MKHQRPKSNCSGNTITILRAQRKRNLWFVSLDKPLEVELNQKTAMILSDKYRPWMFA